MRLVQASFAGDAVGGVGTVVRAVPAGAETVAFLAVVFWRRNISMELRRGKDDRKGRAYVRQRDHGGHGEVLRSTLRMLLR